MVRIIARAIYILESTGAAWNPKLAENLMSLGYKSYEADGDVCMKRSFKPNGNLSYKYILCYVYDLLHIFLKPRKDIDALNMIYRLKEGFG